MRLMALLVCFVFFGCGGSSKGSETAKVASFMQENNLFLEDDTTVDVNANGVDEIYFNEVVTKLKEVYGPIIAASGGNLVVEGDWASSTVNAYASRRGNDYVINLFGGLARRKEVTRDGFMLVACHELGHQKTIFPLYSNSTWASIEGISDYYATAACARKMFATVEPTPDPTPPPAPTEPNCPFAPEVDASPCKGYSFGEAATNCQRSLDGALSLAKLLAALGGSKAPSINTPDKTVVNKTLESHPNSQCRLDVMLAGINCSKVWDEVNTPHSAADLAKAACAQPRCYYRP